VRGVDQSGRVLGGKYRLKRVLGEGGWGAVYEAVQDDLGRRVAVKVLHTDLALSAEGIARFEREAKAAGALGHANIVQVTDFQANPGEPPFIVMDYLDGETLGALLEREGRLAPERAAFVATQVLTALEVAHAAGIVHRDIKPDNVFLLQVSGVHDIVKLLDFGVAKLHGEGAQLTGGGALVGSPAFMAPEQIRGAAVDLRADLWAVAVCIYRALTGLMPFEAESLHALMMKITESAPTPLSALRPDVSPGLVAVVERAMARDPAGRFSSGREMARALEPFSRPTGAARPRGTAAMPVQPSAVPRPAEAHGQVTGPPYPGAPIMPASPSPLAATAPPPMGLAAPAPQEARGSNSALIAVLVGGVALLALLVVGGGAALFFLSKPDEGASPASSAGASTPKIAPTIPVVTTTAAAEPPTAVATATATTPPGGRTPPAPKTPDAPDTPPPAPSAAPGKAQEMMGGTNPYLSGMSVAPYAVAAVRASVNAVMPAVRRCYAATAYEPPEHVFASFSVTATPSGAVSSVDPHEGEARCAKLDACMRGALSAMKLPVSPSGAQIRVSFTATRNASE
jgi:eukaryotic-like serine/threonine-protein kinase